jgi:hypothetical protein
MANVQTDTTHGEHVTNVAVTVDGEEVVYVNVDEDEHVEVGVSGKRYTRIFGPDDDPEIAAVIDGSTNTRIIDNYSIDV